MKVLKNESVSEQNWKYNNSFFYYLNVFVFSSSKIDACGTSFVMIKDVKRALTFLLAMITKNLLTEIFK